MRKTIGANIKLQRSKAPFTDPFMALLVGNQFGSMRCRDHLATSYSPLTTVAGVATSFGDGEGSLVVPPV